MIKGWHTSALTPLSLTGEVLLVGGRGSGRGGGRGGGGAGWVSGVVSVRERMGVGVCWAACNSVAGGQGFLPLPPHANEGSCWEAGAWPKNCEGRVDVVVGWALDMLLLLLAGGAVGVRLPPHPNEMSCWGAGDWPKNSEGWVAVPAAALPH